ncbi:hypothetical protein PPL_05285 [Heterostelium album PN500]|uniref:Rhodanese domain-containing protein n=1 Tax=Heterostelium pallidum (strain ATCC 26659 / Pp 5 / PN500) TaxID=670386 RepID=D3BB99_HETP5|nr:hypothetical protein PPL_05285 [Heterostelium album PN500]EFA81306.1 hypothetical protein PPL_05285 [Heterostelium album PN500]|eukprot:XP_020433424.1 hypothetical protein PPL_05285 [Heterostelium album PN500]
MTYRMRYHLNISRCYIQQQRFNATLQTTRCFSFRNMSTSNKSISFDFQKNDIINKRELEQLIKDNRDQINKPYILIDVRNPTEVEQTGVIESALHLPLGILPAALEMTEDDFQDAFNIPKIQKTGKRSEMAVDMFRAAGYGNSINYPGSAAEWFNLD